MYQLVNFRTKEPVSTDNLVFTGDEAPWEVIRDLSEVRSKINLDYFRKSPPYVSKYLPFLPIRDYSNFVSLEEGASPLIRSRSLGKKLGIDLFFKLESKNPSGSFKDRGSAVELTIAKEFGAKAIVLASTGNMAASCACYAAAARIPCFIFVPEDTPSSKLCQAIAYGGRIVQVRGNYDACARLAKEVAEEMGFYLAGDYAFRVEGQKTAAFEVIEQLFFRPPEAVFVPMGCGTNIAAYVKGFREYRELGLIERLPRIFGVQAAGASPIIQSLQQGKRIVSPVKTVDTLASAIAVGNPLDGDKALDAIYSTNGKGIAVSDQEILEAVFLLSREEGMFVEASCATAVAALMKANDDGSLTGKRVVCVLTGDGLKDPTPMLKVAIKPPTIQADINEFRARYENSFFEGRNVAFVDKASVLFSNEPTTVEVENQLQTLLGLDRSSDISGEVQEHIGEFLKKGKPVTFSDLQDIVQDTLEGLGNRGKGMFVVEDFEVTTWKDKKPKAKVVVKVNGILTEAQAEGVGPVDAVINALKKASSDSVEFALSSFRAEVRSKGTDAVVYVELKLQRNGVVCFGRGTSPDLLQASIEAFVRAYNGFFPDDEGRSERA